MKKTITLIAMLIIGMSAIAKDISFGPADIQGVVFRSDGETPIHKLVVDVWDQSQEKIVYTTKTDRNGGFSLPKYEEGRYFVRVRDVYIDMDVFRARSGVIPQTHSFVVVLPKKMPLYNIPLVISPLMPVIPRVVSP